MAAIEPSLNLPPRALTIAGFDPSAGAGVMADVRTFAAFGLQAVAAITSITFQNTAQVFGAAHQTGATVRAQLLAGLDEFRIICSKTGMLPTPEVVLEVVRFYRETDVPHPVVDPVIVSSSGQRLMDQKALDVLIKQLLPLAPLLTPDIPEAEAISGIMITSETDMRRAAAIIRGMGARAVLIKGGHLKSQKAEGSRQEAGRSPTVREGSRAQAESDDAIDVLDNEGKMTVFRERRIVGAALHGSGCILSAAIAAGLGKGMSLEDSVGAAKSFVLKEIRNSLFKGTTRNP